MSLKPVGVSKEMRFYLSAEGHEAITSLTYYFTSNESLVSTVSPAGVSLWKSQRQEMVSRYQPRFYHVWNKQLNKGCHKCLLRDMNMSTQLHAVHLHIADRSVFHLIIWGSEAVRWMYSIFVGCWYPGPATPLIRPKSLWVHKATSSVTNSVVINPEARPQNWGNGVGLCVWGWCCLVKAPQHQNTGKWGGKRACGQRKINHFLPRQRCGETQKQWMTGIIWHAIHYQ